MAPGKQKPVMADSSVFQTQQDTTFEHTDTVEMLLRSERVQTRQNPCTK